MKGLIIVEDDLIMGTELRELLEEDYAVLAVVPSGEDAVSAVKSLKPDTVLMDIKLKGALDGIEASRRIREFSDVPVIFLTAYKNEAMQKRAALIPHSFFLTKPFDPSFLLDTIAGSVKNP